MDGRGEQGTCGLVAARASGRRHPRVPEPILWTHQASPVRRFTRTSIHHLTGPCSAVAVWDGRYRLLNRQPDANKEGPRRRRLACCCCIGIGIGIGRASSAWMETNSRFGSATSGNAFVLGARCQPSSVLLWLSIRGVWRHAPKRVCMACAAISSLLFPYYASVAILSLSFFRVLFPMKTTFPITTTT